MAKWHIGWDNWFLVIPAAIMGVVALYTVSQMYRAGDIRRSIQVVTTYEVEGHPVFGDYLEASVGPVDCVAEMVSRFYGTLDVSCTNRPLPPDPRVSSAAPSSEQLRAASRSAPALPAESRIEFSCLPLFPVTLLRRAVASQSFPASSRVTGFVAILPF